MTISAPALAKKAAHLASYGGWGSTTGAVFLGRAVKGEPPSGRNHNHRISKLGSTAKAFLRRDLEAATVRVVDVASGKAWQASADDEGFYEVRASGPLPAGPRTFRVELVHRKYDAPPVEITLALAAPGDPGVLVVADIDDTLVHTGVTDGMVDVAVATALRGAADMRAFPSAPAVLAALAAAGAQVVYLSASPIELAPRLLQFLELSGFPAGALLLRYYPAHGFGDPRAYKRERIVRLLGELPGRRVIFFGDNGEKDPELFAEHMSDRVAAAYVRTTVAADPADARYRGMTLFADYREVARDLGRRGLIRWFAAQRIALGEEP